MEGTETEVENPYDTNIDGLTNKAFEDTSDEQTGF